MLADLESELADVERRISEREAKNDRDKRFTYGDLLKQRDAIKRRIHLISLPQIFD